MDRQRRQLGRGGRDGPDVAFKPRFSGYLENDAEQRPIAERDDDALAGMQVKISGKRVRERMAVGSLRLDGNLRVEHGPRRLGWANPLPFLKSGGLPGPLAKIVEIRPPHLAAAYDLYFLKSG
jgi:hypothetical protein